MNRLRTLSTLAALAALTVPVFAQYPTVPPDVKKQADAKIAELKARSEQAWQKALPIVMEWTKKGKPYIPGAAEPKDLPQASIPSFPGAAGGGMFSFGGRGGSVLTVTNLNDTGPGSLRDALETGGPRIIVFNVAGVIHLKTRIVVRAPYVTIAGNTAPGDGVCIAGDTLELETHDVVIRHMRFRRGEGWVGDRNDSLGGNPVGNIMIDHVSATWGLDENLSMYRHMYQPPTGGKELKLPTVNITIQNSLSAEALNTYNHAFGSTIGGLNSTFHHNLWANNTGRNPSIGMYGDFTLVNNVIYNWHHRSVDGGDQRSLYNIYNNTFKPGPATPVNEAIGHRILKPEAKRIKPRVDEYGKAFVNGNRMVGNDAVTADNWNDGVQIDSLAPAATLLPQIRVDKPFDHAWLPTQTADESYTYVLANAGATLPCRDSVDTRIIEGVRTGVPSYKDGIITDIAQVGGYPEYKGTPYIDTDGDGMPDDWELAHGLNPKDPSDALTDLNGDGYTNIEDYINGLDPRAPAKDWKDPKNWVDARNAR